MTVGLCGRTGSWSPPEETLRTPQR